MKRKCRYFTKKVCPATHGMVGGCNGDYDPKCIEAKKLTEQMQKAIAHDMERSAPIGAYKVWGEPIFEWRVMQFLGNGNVNLFMKPTDRCNLPISVGLRKRFKAGEIKVVIRNVVYYVVEYAEVKTGDWKGYMRVVVRPMKSGDA